MQTYTTDVLVIGSGGAGLRAAITLHDKKVDVLVVGKCKKREAHTSWATGGINAALKTMDKKDSWQLHAADTIADGGLINDPRAVALLAKHAPAAVRELKRWGCPFHLEKNGKITQRFFGAATYRRACFVGDSTGKAILNTLVDQADKRKIKTKPLHYVYQLLTHKGKVNGAIALNMRTGKSVVFHAKKVILATGGHSRVYKRASSHFWENTGDGITLATQVGAQCMDMELFQFHPTGMVYPEEASGLLVTEAVRGEGGILTNAKGERFMKRYDPKRMELSARDIVAKSIYNEVRQGRGTRHGGVYLDISHKSKAYILKRLPKMYKQFKKYMNIDISKQKMTVAPTAHYSMGGIRTEHGTGKTSIKNLYAIGEVTAGVHGGNRLGGNSLAECMVFGKLTGEHIAKNIKKTKLLPLDREQVEHAKINFEANLKTKGENPTKIKKQIQKIMWENVGVTRDEKRMKKALRLLKSCKKPLRTGKKTAMNEKLLDALDVANMLPVCEMIIHAALMRKESRRAHFRSDYPKRKASWKKNIVCTPSPKGIKYSTAKVPSIPKEIAKLVAKETIKDKLLE